jgi:hypothetical protein
MLQSHRDGGTFGDLAELSVGCQLSRLPDVPAEIRRQGKLDPVNAAGSAEDIPKQFPWQPRQRPHLVQLHLRMVGLKGLGVRREGRHASVCHRRRRGEQPPAGASVQSDAAFDRVIDER